MKLLSISLTNVRRFAGMTVRLDGLGDGLNLVSAPNEAGKSTLFEALQALLFLQHRSGAAEARGLRPYSGGAPEVAAEVEVGGVRYRIEKRWLSRASARVVEAGTECLVAQDDEAEDWIARNLVGDRQAELLWVRQGMLDLEPEGKAEQERLTKIRRDLLSSVAAQVDAVTGGRRLDALVARCDAELAKIATPTCRPQASGPWGVALKEAEALGKELADLDARCADLADALAERADVRAALALARDPVAAKARTAEVERTARAAEDARAHQLRVSEACTQERAATLDHDKATRALAEHDAATRDLAGAETAKAAANAALGSAETTLETARTKEAETGAAAEVARSVHTAARAAADAADRAARANEAAARAADVEGRLARAQTRARAAKEATAEARAIAVAEVDVAAARRAASDLDRARARMEAGAVAVAVGYLPGVAARIRIDGQPLDPGAPLACAGPTTLEIPGLGWLTLTPGGDAAKAAADAAEAETALAAILAPAGAADLDALVALVVRRGAAEAAAAEALAEIAGLAPEGTAALEAEIARHRSAAAGADPEAPDPGTTRAAEESARTAAETAGVAADSARTARIEAEQAEKTARDRHAGAERTHAAAAETAAALPPRADLALAVERTRVAADEARRKADALAAMAPDAAAAETAHAEANRAVREADVHATVLDRREGQLETLIATRADEAVEERCEETAGRLEEAETRAAGYAAEARALTRLRKALTDARTETRDRYLAPVAAELGPLLGLVLGGTDLRLHPTRLLPEALVRDGREEDLACLSGGTREQIAILTRLAFARLLARTGRATPVILDDALVYADDARFARVLAALRTVAEEVQVIVLTCRERAFADLPASRPALRHTALHTAAAPLEYQGS
jgi:hypothetical protein